MNEPRDPIESALRTIQEAQRAREFLYERFQEDVVAVIRRDFPPRLRARLDPEDVYHESFVRALRNLDTFEWKGPASFRAYLKTIATNYTRDVLRRGSLTQQRLDAGGSGDSFEPETSPENLRDTEAFRNREAIDTYLAYLRPEEEKIVRLRMLEDLPFAVIGEQVGKSDDAVRKIFNRAIEQLSRRIRGE